MNNIKAYKIKDETVSYLSNIIVKANNYETTERENLVHVLIWEVLSDLITEGIREVN
jgi:hypothetical protein